MGFNWLLFLSSLIFIVLYLANGNFFQFGSKVFWYSRMVFSFSLGCQDISGHLVYFLLLTWNLPFLQEASVSFNRKWYVKTKVLALGSPIGLSLFLGFFREFILIFPIQIQDYRVCALPFLYYICIFSCLHWKSWFSKM